MSSFVVVKCCVHAAKLARARVETHGGRPPKKPRNPQAAAIAKPSKTHRRPQVQARKEPPPPVTKGPPGVLQPMTKATPGEATPYQVLKDAASTNLHRSLVGRTPKSSKPCAPGPI